MASFVDRVVLHVAGGDGGHGVASVHREKFKPLGGPDGGNGGRGGDVVLVVDPSTTTLLEYHHTPHRNGGKGAPGEGGMRHGRNGEDVELRVPSGTIVKDSRGGIIADLVGAGTRFVVAAGGRGGLGNAALASARRKAPGFALLGEPGHADDIVLELKSVADVGSGGLPERRQVEPDRRAVGRASQDRRLPVHHARAEPRRRAGRRRAVHRRPTCPA